MQQRSRVEGDILENAPRVDADIFFLRIKKMRFQKYPHTVGRGLSIRYKYIILFNSLYNDIPSVC